MQPHKIEKVSRKSVTKVQLTDKINYLTILKFKLKKGMHNKMLIAIQTG